LKYVLSTVRRHQALQANAAEMDALVEWLKLL
jgi:hypothetical protein